MYVSQNWRENSFLHINIKRSFLWNKSRVITDESNEYTKGKRLEAIALRIIQLDSALKVTNAYGTEECHEQQRLNAYILQSGIRFKSTVAQECSTFVQRKTRVSNFSISPLSLLHMHRIISLKQLDLSLRNSLLSVLSFIHRVRMNNFIHQPFGPIMYIRRMKHDFFFFQNYPPLGQKNWGKRGAASLIEKLIRFQSWEHSFKAVSVKNFIIESSRTRT